MQAMDRMEAILVALATKTMPPRVREEKVGGRILLLKVGHYDFDDVVGLAFDQIRRAETGALARAGLAPCLKKMRWALLKHRRHWTKKERRRTVADDLYQRLLQEKESFWTVVYPLYMQREITRGHVRDIIEKGLEEARGNYKIVSRIFNMQAHEYKKFLNFLRKHDCQLPFKDYR